MATLRGTKALVASSAAKINADSEALILRLFH